MAHKPFTPTTVEKLPEKSAGPHVPEKQPEDLGNLTASQYDWLHASNQPQPK